MAIPKKIQHVFFPSSIKEESPAFKTKSTKFSLADINRIDLLEKTEKQLTRVISNIIKVSEDQIETNVPLPEYGIDSVLIMYIISQLEEIFGSLTKTLLFEYENIKDLAVYFSDFHKEKLLKWLDIQTSPPSRKDALSLKSTINDSSKIIAPLKKQSYSDTILNNKSDKPIHSKDNLLENTEDQLKKIISPIIKISVDQLKSDVPFDEYGVDSVIIMYIISQLEEIFGSLTKTLLFEYVNIQSLSAYFVENHLEPLMKWLGIQTTKNVVNRENELDSIPHVIKNSNSGRVIQDDLQDSDIAIIGLSGRFPGANNLSEFWENLKNRKDCITNIPKERWDNSEYFSSNTNRLGKIYADWGGFISDVEMFDARFFEIHEREAEWINPAERLFPGNSLEPS